MASASKYKNGNHNHSTPYDSHTLIPIQGQLLPVNVDCCKVTKTFVYKTQLVKAKGIYLTINTQVYCIYCLVSMYNSYQNTYSQAQYFTLSFMN